MRASTGSGSRLSLPRCPSLARLPPLMEPVLWFGWFRADIIAEYAELFWRGLGMTVGAVYTAKSRALDRIKKEIAGLQDY